MAKEKCNICGNEIKHGFMDKIIGTIIKEDNKVLYICNICQKEKLKSVKQK